MIETGLSLAEYFEHLFEWAAHRDQWTGFIEKYVEDYEFKFGFEYIRMAETTVMGKWVICHRCTGAWKSSPLCEDICLTLILKIGFMKLTAHKPLWFIRLLRT